MLEKCGVIIRSTNTKYKQTHTVFVEALNKLLVEQLFKVQDMQELNDPKKVSSTWVKHLYGLIDQLDGMKTQMTGIKPKEATELKKVPLVERYPPEDKLPEGGLCCYLLQLSEEHNDQHKKATDRIWSKKTYRLSKVVLSPGNPVMYYFIRSLGKWPSSRDPDQSHCHYEIMWH